MGGVRLVEAAAGMTFLRVDQTNQEGNLHFAQLPSTFKKYLTRLSLAFFLVFSLRIESEEDFAALYAIHLPP
jgi:hypothetical protein